MEKLEVADKFLAFEGHEREEQHRFILASSFSDLWTEVKDEAGRAGGGHRQLVHLSGKDPLGPPTETIPAAECLRVTPSKDWGRKFDDPLATKQRYYCSCSRRFNATWGQIVEISRCTHGGSIERMYVRADVPSWDVEDIRAMSLERTH